MADSELRNLTAQTAMDDTYLVPVSDDTTGGLEKATIADVLALGGGGPSWTGPASSRLGSSAEGMSLWQVTKSGINTQIPDWGKPRLMLSYVIGGYTPTDLSISIDTAANAQTDLHMVIYNRAADGLPGTLAASWTFTADAVGVETLTGQSTAMPDTGWYWCGVHLIQRASETQPTIDVIQEASGWASSATDYRNVGVVSNTTHTAGANLSSAAFDTSRFVLRPLVIAQVN